ncbi:MAG: UDP-N-acetylglucosamine--N-acetylmuramyl-(pentapeptide) pyrophosphoryl-undecaprenol N-acetylglucosamine transferase [Acetobacteraceae bacterium]|nr:UDP-N-acetylglucosamine--N-acetylmuramyl-(pentapeptide) pyrophosphoryl-undecaprenol N-acetylglucosamine transferase [Acetobacteraceae bacterium]
MVRPIVIAAGGTGGHLFPAEALAGTLAARGCRVALMTDARSGAIAARGFAGLETFVLRGEGLAGRGLARAPSALAALGAGTVQAARILARIGAAAVVGFGGYPSFPPLLAAGLLRRRPVRVLHEQNAVLGRANRFLAGRVDRIALSFPATMGLRAVETAKCVVTGNPVRPAIAGLHGIAYTPPSLEAPLRLLVLGGSLGARIFADIVPAALAGLAPAFRARLSVVQQVRAEDLCRVGDAYALAGIAAELAPFFDDVDRRLAACHLILARAGGGQVAEAATAGRPAIFVPLPSAIDDHQTENARAAAEAGAALVMPQPAFTAEALGARLEDFLCSPALLSRMAAAASSRAVPDAAGRLADLVQSLVPAEVRA